MDVRSAAGPGPSRGWRVSPGLVALKLAGTVIFAVVALVTVASRVDPVGVLVAGLTAVGFGAFALRDLRVPVRVAADPDGLTVVAGFARRVRLSWSQVERVGVDVRSRYGLRSEHLEIDAGESIYVFGAAELSAPVTEVAAALNALRP